ncbi:MAG: type II secretion system protein [Acetanaerobacterium sp.]
MLAQRKNNKGFTLIELLICIAVFGLLFVAIAMFIVPTINFFAKTRNIAEAKGVANLVMDYIEGSVYSTDVLELREVTAVPAPDSDDKKTFYLLSSDPSGNNGVLTVYREGDDAHAALGEGISSGYVIDCEFSTAQSRVLRVSITIYLQRDMSELYSLNKDIYLANMYACGADITERAGDAQPFREILFYRCDGSEVLSP